MASWSDDEAVLEAQHRRQNSMVYDVHIEDEEADEEADEVDYEADDEGARKGKGKGKLVDKKK